MFDDNEFRSKHRYGSAAWASEADLRRAGLFGSQGIHLGYWDQKQIRLSSDAPAIVFGGSGSGKTRDFLSNLLCDLRGVPALVLDPRGELAAITHHIHARHDEYAYSWNPLHIGAWLASHACNPLDILKPGSPSLDADATAIANGLVSLRQSSGDNGSYFELRARELIKALLKSGTDRFGSMSFPKLARLINAMEGDLNAWSDHIDFMKASRHDDVRRIASEALNKQFDSPREWGSILGSVYAATGFLSDESLLASLQDGFSLNVLVNAERVSKVFLNIPAEFLSQWAPLIRVFFSTAMLYKARTLRARRLLLVVDEAGQLETADFLKRGFTYARGTGTKTLALFQDAGQVETHYGRSGLQTFLSSAETRLWFGIRDAVTAELVSRMAGTETLEYEDELATDLAKRRRQEIAKRALLGESPLLLGQEAAQLERASQHRVKQARPLLSLDEAMALPEDKALLFLSGRNLRPAIISKYPYFTRRELAGKYLANPLYEDGRSVSIQTRFGQKRLRVNWVTVPQRLKDFPQYVSGTMPIIEGFPI